MSLKMCFFPFSIVLLSFWAIAAQSTSSLSEAMAKAGYFVKCPDDSYSERCIRHPDVSQYLPILPEDANANAILHCRDLHLMVIKHNPGLFVIEWTSTKGVWTNATVSKGSFATFANLENDTLYQFRLYRVTDAGVSRPETTAWISTTEAEHTPQNITAISLESLRMDENYKGGFRAEINFSPADDRHCYYDVLRWEHGEGDLDHLNLSELREPEEFHITLKKLDYGRNYSIGVTAKTWDGLKESGRIWLDLVTPGCLEYHNNNLTICPPRQVQGLQAKEVVREGNLVDITATWDDPVVRPDNYSLKIVSWEPSENCPRIFILGNETKALLSGVNVGHQYGIKIVAHSAGGDSSEASTYREIAVSYDNFQGTSAGPKFGGVAIAVIFPAITLLLVGLGGLYAYHRFAKRRRYQERCKYFETLDRKDGVFETASHVLKADFAVENDEVMASADEFEISPDRLLMKDVLGIGAFGVVRLGTLRGDRGQVTDVAVKMLRKDSSTDDITNFHQEILMMKSTGQHPNIVSLVGCCTMECSPLLVVEYCSRGDLQSYLRMIWENMTAPVLEHKIFCDGNSPPVETEPTYNNIPHTSNIIADACTASVISNRLYDIDQECLHSGETITAADLLNFGRQIAIGMEFLSTNRIVHRDLAARNVLVCADRTVKISDFGLSRDIYQENVYKKKGNGRLPIKWMAIESLTHEVYSTHSDVWSFGILLWEIVTLGSSPYPGTPTNRVLALLKSGYRMERPRNCGIQLYNIMLSCWRGKARERPTFTELRYELDRLLCSVTENQYLDLSDILRESVTSTDRQPGTGSPDSPSSGSHKYLTHDKYMDEEWNSEGY